MKTVTLLQRRLTGFLLCSSVLLLGTTWAGASALEGVVKDQGGHGVSGAVVRIEGNTGSNVAKTDATGHYVSGALPPGDYKVSLIIDGSVKASINNAGVRTGNATQLNFELTASSARNNGKHMVWVPAQTGTNLGGRWVPVDDSSNTAGPSNIQIANAEALRKIQSIQQNSRGR